MEVVVCVVVDPDPRSAYATQEAGRKGEEEHPTCDLPVPVCMSINFHLACNMLKTQNNLLCEFAYIYIHGAASGHPQLT